MATKAFAYLESDFRFTATLFSPEHVRFEGSGVFVSVRFDGRNSYELGVEIGQLRPLYEGRERPFNFGEVLRLAGSSDAKDLACVQVTEQGALERFTNRMAMALETHAASLLRGDQGAFDRLAALRLRESIAYEHRTDLRLALEGARAAWKRQDFARVARLLGPFEQELPPSERMRLKIARSRGR